jgi:hypothetical protein
MGFFSASKDEEPPNASLTDYVTESLVEYVTVFPNTSTKLG